MSLVNWFRASLNAVKACAALSLLLAAVPAFAQTITDVVVFRIDSSGNTVNEGWNTRGNDNISNLYLLSSGSFLNSGNASATRIALDLTAPGVYTYSFIGDNVNTNTSIPLGINLFASNGSSPVISARGLPSGGFVANGGKTSGIDGIDFFSQIAGANALTFTSTGRQITLSDFTFQTSTGTDSVSSFDNVANGFGDTIGSFTLTVVSVVPEAGTFALFGVAFVPVAAFVVRRRKVSGR